MTVTSFLYLTQSGVVSGVKRPTKLLNGEPCRRHHPLSSPNTSLWDNPRFFCGFFIELAGKMQVWTDALVLRSLRGSVSVSYLAVWTGLSLSLRRSLSFPPSVLLMIMMKIAILQLVLQCMQARGEGHLSLSSDTSPCHVTVLRHAFVY